jgi:hypothetical protein
VLITEMEWQLLPVVETAGGGETPQDRRKTHRVGWKEVRLVLVHEPGSVAPIVGATLGGVEEAGERLAVCAMAAGEVIAARIRRTGWRREELERQSRAGRFKFCSRF